MLRFFRGLGTKHDQLRDNAERLVKAANIYAISMYTPMVDQFPFLRKEKPDQWDFVVTIAGVFIAAVRLGNLKIDERRELELMDIIARSLTQWDPNNGMRGFEDCKEMFDRTFGALTDAHHEPRFIASDALGSWVVWSLLAQSPEHEEELKLVRSIGAAITHTFFSWWADPAK